MLLFMSSVSILNKRLDGPGQCNTEIAVSHLSWILPHVRHERDSIKGWSYVPKKGLVETVGFVFKILQRTYCLKGCLLTE